MTVSHYAKHYDPDFLFVNLHLYFSCYEKPNVRCEKRSFVRTSSWIFFSFFLSLKLKKGFPSSVTESVQQILL